MGKLEKKTLDEIAKVLVKADAFSSRDLDQVTSNPALFDSVRARLKLAADVPARKRSFVGGKLGVSFASIAIIAAVGLALVVFRSKPVDVVRHPAPAATSATETKTFPEPDKVAAPDFRRPAQSVKAERISTKPETRVNRPRQSAAQQIRYEGDFYALSYAGDPNETERGGRIVRVDVSRSTLFAMGVDVPLENETDTVKADLLIGSDGVTRAIRLVR